MPNFENDLQNALAEAQRELFIEQIRRHPELSLADLLALGKGKFSNLLNDVTVGHLLGDADARPSERRPGRPAKAATANKAKAATPARPAAAATGAAAPGGTVNTRTPEGREAYDEAVLGALRSVGGPANSEQIRPLAGGTSLQLRTSLTRLANEGKITWEGQARGTRYSLV
ncbi:MAG: hypothetical protein B7733_13650 [Myxococcales bacterium FL481]|nr:MAG: hypothetical protein B7733_13650 [Myxococcales bacterium FL481]